MRVTSLFNCSIVTRNIAIEEVLMDSHIRTHVTQQLIMVDLDRMFQKRFENEMEIIFGTISSIFSPKRPCVATVDECSKSVEIILTFLSTCHRSNFWLIYSDLFLFLGHRFKSVSWGHSFKLNMGKGQRFRQPCCCWEYDDQICPG